MSKDLIDFLAVVITVIWFAWLYAWPYAVALGSVVCAVAAGLLFRRGRVKLGLVLLSAFMIFITFGFLIFTESEHLMYGLLPGFLQPFGQFVLLLLPFFLWLGGLVWLAQTLWRFRASPNQPLHPILGSGAPRRPSAG